MGKCLQGLLRSKPSTLLEKQLRLKQDRVRQVLALLGTNQKECITRKELLAAQKEQFIELLRTQWSLAKSTRKFCKKMKRETAKASFGWIQQNIME